jgi:hypothetical protein
MRRRKGGVGNGAQGREVCGAGRRGTMGMDALEMELLVVKTPWDNRYL